MPLLDSIYQRLQSREPLPPLCPSAAWSPEISQQLQSASDDELFTNMSTHKKACRAGLLLWNDDLQASHEVSQGIEDATGSFWHAIMHRREADFSNSNYWWRRTETHPAFANVYVAVGAIIETEENKAAQRFYSELQHARTWHPEAFLALCEAAQRDSKSDDTWLRRAQQAEIKALVDWCRSND